MNHFLNKKNILLFCPQFLDYDQILRGGLIKQGARVKLYDERPSQNSIIKALLRINPYWLSFLSNRYFLNIFEKEKNTDFDYIFIIKGEALTPKVINIMKKYFKNSKLIFYSWDSLKNVKYMDKKIDLFDKAFSFDRADCDSFKNVSYQPLFFSSPFSFKTNKALKVDKKYDLIFIASLHSDRYKVLNKILNNTRLNKPDISFYSFLFYPSKLFFLLRKIFDRQFYKVSFKEVQWQSLSQHEVIKRIMQSKIVIDINHPMQTGLTMRTIECMALKKKIITTNMNIKYEKFYSNSNILIIDRHNPIIPKDFIDSPYQDIVDEDIDYYSLETWISRIFSDNKSMHL